MTGDVNIDAVVAGHTCMDMFPEIRTAASRIQDVLLPGKLIETGPMMMATGGAVPNTGGALQRFGIRTLPMGKVGDDPLGNAILDKIRGVGMNTAGMVITRGDSSSYTVVINVKGIDRIFLHCPGPNETFDADDIDYDTVAKARLFHFGYPPLMRGMYVDGGSRLADMLQRAKSRGVTTSLDLARPDPESDAGRVDWQDLLTRALPHVDIAVPSIDEIVYMLERERFESLVTGTADRKPLGGLSLADIDRIAGRLLGLGASIVLLKLGECGAYLKTTSSEREIADIGPSAPRSPEAWAGLSLYSPCFQAVAAGATGAGDCTIAGFLAALLYGQEPAQALDSAVGAGACNVEQADALSGVPDWNALQSRIRGGWSKQPPLE